MSFGVSQKPTDIWATFESRIQQNPDADAVVCASGATISYQALGDLILQFDLGCFEKKKGIVALTTSDPLEQIAGIWAAIAQGCGYWVVPGDFGIDEINEYLNSIPDLETDVAAAYLTSGSSGKSKLIRRTQEQIRLRVDAYSEECHFNQKDRFALTTHPGFVAAESEVFGSLLSGGSLHLLDPRTMSSLQFSKAIRERAITILHPPIPFFESWRAGWDPSDSFPSLRCLLFGGGKLPTESVRGIWSHLSNDAMIHHRFSSTEAGPISRFILRSDQVYPASDRLPVGIPYSFVDWKLSNPDEGGSELLLKSPGLSPDAELDADGYFHTRDQIGQGQGGEWHFLGRQDSLVKVRGYRVNMEKVASHIRLIPGVLGACVTLIEDSSRRSRLIGFVEVGPPHPGSSEILKQVMINLPDWECPGQIVVLDVIPVTETGKYDTQKLIGLAQSQNEGFSPSSSLEDSLSHLWLSVTGWIGELDRELPLIEQGGDSLAVISFLVAVEKAMNFELSQVEFLQNGSISALARCLSARPENESMRHGSINLLNQGGFKTMVCFPVGGEAGLRYWEFAKELEGEFSVYVLSPHGVDGAHRPFTSVEEQVIYYRGLIEQEFGADPIVLCGLSIGGVAAFAVACSGKLNLDQLVLLDTQLSRSKRGRKQKQSRFSLFRSLREHRLRIFEYAWQQRYQIRNEIRFGGIRRMHQMRDWIQHELVWSLKDRFRVFLGRAWWIRWRDDGRRFPIPLRDSYFLDLNRRARAKFHPSVYSGSVHFVATNGFYGEGPDARAAPWKLLCENLTISYVDTDHARICSQPQVQTTAHIIAEYEVKTLS